MIFQRVSLAMIVRNEGSRIAKCLASVKDVVDEIVVVDTGSCDDTVQIARTFTDKVYCLPWQNDFAAARNFAIDQTTHEWILSLDADERLDAKPGELHALINQPRYSAYCLPLYALKVANDGREQERIMVLRLFRREHRYKGFVHEYVHVSDPATIGVALSPAIYHDAVAPAERRRRRGRNIALLKKALAKEPDDPFWQYYLGAEWLGLGRIELAAVALRQALSNFSLQQVTFRSAAVRYLMQCYKHLGEIDKAICLCLEESERYPDYCDLFFDGGVLFELKGEYEVARKWFQEAVKLGPPALAYFHTDGTNGYLAHYHLGYCAEKLGLYNEAMQYYVAALNNTQNYYYPLYQLVLLKLTRHSVQDVVDFLAERNYLKVPEVAEKMAELFWTLGMPAIALRCLTHSNPEHDTGWELLAKCQIYGGDIYSALQCLRQMRRQGKRLSGEVLGDEIVALLMLERCAEAREKLWELWREREYRDIFWAAFCLYKKMCCAVSQPLVNRKAVAALLDLRRRCLVAQPCDVRKQQRFAEVIKAVHAVLASEPVATTELLAELEQAEQELKHTARMRGLYR
ncbi:glycosyl transferase, family 2 [Thermosinus carboxydivorans Nor1]|uniref:Glycosyl transferase, family 2 n=1 Tax=Thermosinus carboxydivorans Nor1 TaxID=401526 RepID=A1HSR8_9FIRM|nr:glycosyltransferase [Thermosinus carboxydivorans]EAX46949.1 glycosyl transferase, family 2 [Thermosinus carboxydivorans Nor1]